MSSLLLKSPHSRNGALQPNNVQLNSLPPTARGSAGPLAQKFPIAIHRRSPVETLAGEDFNSLAEQARKRAMETSADLGKLKFALAAQKWLQQREMYVQEGTINCYRDYLSRLNKFFAEMILEAIHIGHFQEYQRVFKSTYHPASINHDLNTLSQMLRQAGLWQPIAEHYRTLPVPRRPKPRVLTDKQESDFFELAASEKQWDLAYLEASLSNNTTAYGIELRLMRRSDTDLNSTPPTITVPLEAKNQYRPRVIPLNEHGREMVRRMLERAAKIGSTRPEHYLFPFRVKRGMYDPTRPASSSWTNSQWRKLVAKALERKIIPFRISRRNFRNQPITKMLEAGVPIETVRAVAGHVSEEMTRYYAQHRLEIRAQAVNLINPPKKKPTAFSTGKNGKGVSA